MKKSLLITAITVIAIFTGCVEEKSQTNGSDKTVYSCTMHHQVKEEKPGPCPICGMTMVIVPDINDW